MTQCIARMWSLAFSTGGTQRLRRPRGRIERVFMKAALWTLSVSAAASAAPSPIYVDADAPAGGDGTSWAAAFAHLQDALAVAAPRDEIRVAGGTYKPDRGAGQSLGNRAATFQLKNGVALYGGFAGLGAPDPNLRDIVLNKTTLSGDLNGNGTLAACTQDSECNANGELCADDGFCIIAGNNAENSFHVLTGSGTDATAILDGFMIDGGNADATEGLARSGGGMINFFGSPTVTNCTFSGNSASNSGGGMDNLFSSPTVTNCTFSGNSAFGGGGMYNFSSSPTVTNCTFSGNAVKSYGAGLYNVQSTPTVSNCIFRGNTADFGGGMFNQASSPTVTNCTFSGNSVPVGSGGGGMYNWLSSNPVLTECTFSGNSASGGGGLYNNGSSPTITNCTFSGNSANVGGGIYNIDSRPPITNCTFSGNSGNAGGGIYNINSSPAVTNCTFSGNSGFNGGGMYNTNNSSPAVTDCAFSGNSARSGGGAMINWTQSNPMMNNCTFSANSALQGGAMLTVSGGSPTVNNSVLWGNRPDEVFNFDPSVDTPTVGFSDVKGGLSAGTIDGGGNIDADPLLVDALGPDNTPGTEDDDLRLGPGSPCIDAGDNRAVPADVTRDLRGNRRFFDDPDSPDTGVGPPPIVDMGAYEFGSVPCNPADFDCDGDVDLYDFARWVDCFHAPDAIGCNPLAIPDLNGDGQVGLVDHALFVANLTGPGF